LTRSTVCSDERKAMPRESLFSITKKHHRNCSRGFGPRFQGRGGAKKELHKERKPGFREAEKRDVHVKELEKLSSRGRRTKKRGRPDRGWVAVQKN